MLPVVLLLVSAPAILQDAPLQMMTYQMVLLRAAPGHGAQAHTPEAERKQEAHLAKLARLNRERGAAVDDAEGHTQVIQNVEFRIQKAVTSEF